MEGSIAIGSTLLVERAGTQCTIEAFLAAGGQGEVYRARLGHAELALKWYLPGWVAPEQRAALLELVRRGPPGPSFLWPVDLVSMPGRDGFGYLMALREDRFSSMVDLMHRKVEPGFRTLATVGLSLADSFLQLHAAGLCYRDISFGNVFFDPANGDVAVCDNDNVGVDGAAVEGIIGTPRFMAPELVLGTALPDSRTDLWSLAVLLFYIFFVHHPLEGRRERDTAALDPPAMRELYGTRPVFVFDPADESNRPVAGEQDNAVTFWRIYPEAVRSLFVRAFTDGIRDPDDGRVREGEWRRAMADLRDCIVYCGDCGAENFADTSGDAEPRPVTDACWRCAVALSLPFSLRIGRSEVMLNHDTELFPHHLVPDRLYDFTVPLAAVTAHPSRPGVWGLRNLGVGPWRATRPDGRVLEVAPGRSLPLERGTAVGFGATRGEIGLAAHQERLPPTRDYRL